MKKILAIVFAFVLCLACGVGCKEDEKKPTATDGDDKNWTGFY
jgi:hypothetical protein